MYPGSVNSDGTADLLPVGWTSSKTSTGHYTVTHSLGTTSFAVVTTPFDSSGSRDIVIDVVTRTTTTFTINSISSGSDTDKAFFFILMLI